VNQLPHLATSVAAPEELLAACQMLLFAENPATPPQSVENLHNWLVRNEFATVFVARSGETVCAATLAEVLPGALGVLWLPVGDSREACDSVAHAACAWLRQRGVKICQAFSQITEHKGAQSLMACGFQHNTELVFLCAKLAEEQPRELRASLTYEPHSLPFTPQFRETLLATHLDSRDCPELTNNRTTEDLLAGFAATPNAEFTLLLHDGEPVGVLVVEMVYTALKAEISYLGVLPAFRGRGFGRELVEYAMREARESGVLAVTLSADAHNEPALRLYHSCGFAETDRQYVWLCVLPS
jgi:ribosomal protein S18 acetylase RimI-like enzyme